MTKLKITSKKTLAHVLGVPIEHLERISSSVPAHTHSFLKTEGEKTRRIYEADWALEKIQRQVERKILERIEVPQEIKSNVKGRSLRENAELHTNKKNVAHFDIKSFYPSVKKRRVTAVFVSMGCAPDVARILTSLVTADGHVPHGYCTSPKLANLVLFTANERLRKLLARYGLEHSFWVDDLTISGDYPVRKLSATIARIFAQEKLPLNEEKSGIIQYQSQRQTVTKMIVNRKVAVRKEKRGEIRVLLHLCEKDGVRSVRRKYQGSKTLLGFIRWLGGKISYLMSVDRVRYEPWRSRWEKVLERDGLLAYAHAPLRKK
jgi:hypothetical protein